MIAKLKTLLETGETLSIAGRGNRAEAELVER